MFGGETISSTCRRFFIAFICIALVFALTVPAFAAGEVSSVPGYIYMFGHTFSVDDFVFDGEKYVIQNFRPSGVSLAEADICLVSFGDDHFELPWMHYSSDVYSNLYFIGNISLLDSSEQDNGYGFLFGLNWAEKSKCFFIFTASFYNTHFISNGASEFTISFSVPEVDSTVSSIMDGSTTVFQSAMSMVGSVASAIFCSPILYLPIVIGLCGLGISFFRRLKQ